MNLFKLISFPFQTPGWLFSPLLHPRWQFGKIGSEERSVCSWVPISMNWKKPSWYRQFSIATICLVAISNYDGAGKNDLWLVHALPPCFWFGHSATIIRVFKSVIDSWGLFGVISAVFLAQFLEGVCSCFLSKSESEWLAKRLTQSLWLALCLRQD